MSKPVRGFIWWREGGDHPCEFNNRPVSRFYEDMSEECLDNHDGEATILPHSDGKVGEFEPWMAEMLKAEAKRELSKGGVQQHRAWFLIAAAIAGLFEEEK